MNTVVCFSLLLFVGFLHVSVCQEDSDIGAEDRKLHKHKKKRRPYLQQASPCYDGFSRENVPDSRSLIGILGGAAVGYHLGTKFQKQPVINNNIYNQFPPGAGSPCLPLQNDIGIGGYGDGGHGGLLGSHPLLASHLGGHGGHGGFGGHRQGVNWDRTIRQFERHVVRPLTRWW